MGVKKIRNILRLILWPANVILIIYFVYKIIGEIK